MTGAPLSFVASVAAYIVAEGKVDAAAIGDAAQKIQDAVEIVADEE